MPMIVLPFLLVAAASCPKPPPVKALVTAGLDPVSVATDFQLPELRRLAQQAGSAAAHPPYGFYRGDVAYAIDVHVGNKTQSACPGPVEVRLSIRLTNRRIEVAQELGSDSCKFDRVTAHYQRHAEADKAVFERYVMRVTATLSHAPAAAFVVDPAEGPVRKQIAAAVENIIEPVLASMDADRVAIRQAVDTPAEVRGLERPCSGQPGNEL